jgi:hypothetical protein
MFGELKRFWLRFDASDHPYFIAASPIGVTGYDLDDCLRMVRAVYGPVLPPLIDVVEHPDLSHTRGLGVPIWRGIWRPYMNIGGPEPLEHLDSWSWGREGLPPRQRPYRCFHFPTRDRADSDPVT